MNLQETLILGIDLGIASCGWALIENKKEGSRIVGLGVRTFDAPETAKERTPTNQLRRQHRGLRRVIRRRRQRMNKIRQMFQEAGLIREGHKDALKIPGLDPWQLRSAGLDRALTGQELAIALGHIAKHRGFKSNSKRDRNKNESNDSSKMLAAIEATRQRSGQYRTIGEMFAKDPQYIARRRNRDNDYTRSILRDDQEREVRLLFDRQRHFGNRAATVELEQQFTQEAFFQRPLADSESKVGECPFELGQQRAAKLSYSFELFRLLCRLATLRIKSSAEPRPLTSDQIKDASTDFGKNKGLTFLRLRKLLDLADADRFDGVSLEDEKKRDVVARKGSAAPGTYALREALGEAWRTLLPDKIDRIAFVLSFREDLDSIRNGLEEIGLEPLVLDAIMRGVSGGDFSEFKGAGHISAKACRKLIPHLKQGLDYSGACKAAGYDHAVRRQIGLDEIANPVARKALTEGLKQVRAIINEYGLPGRIHVELARDVGKSTEERDEIRSGIERRNKEKDRLRIEFKETVGREPTGAEDMLRFELWREQAGRCLYTDKEIHPNSIVASDNTIQVDHILPWSRSGDDSFVNKCLCYANANQEKKGQTPFEWLGGDDTRWASLTARVEGCKSMKGRKKRNYLLRDASILEEKFRSRNLNDTRYATRLLADMLARLYPGDGKRYVFARPGPLTDRLRRGWGVQNLKKDATGKRIDDDRHHALDALVVAVTTEGALNELTRAFREAERIGAHRDFSCLEPPWPTFVADTKAELAKVFVSRAERRRARGEAHAATIRQIAEDNGQQVVYERKGIDALTEADLKRVKDPERNAKLVASLEDWIAAGKPKDRPPLSPKGDAITKVRLRTTKKADVLIRDGAADRGNMVRVDVFRKKNRKEIWEYFLVPVYPHQVADMGNWPQPPNRAVQAYKPENEWPEMTPAFEFLWSLHPNSFVELEKSDGTLINGYFSGLHRSTGAVTLTAHNSKNAAVESIGARTLKSFAKFNVDRLGRRYRICGEARTWHGAVCT